MRQAMLRSFVAPHIAAACAAHQDQIERAGRERDGDVEFQVDLFRATDPEAFVLEWIADPAADLAGMYKAMLVHGADTRALGAACRRAMMNRMREAAEHVVGWGDR